jgi:hypothetical protein
MTGDGSAHGGFIAGVGRARCLAHHAGLHVIARPALHLRIPAPTAHTLLPLPLAASYRLTVTHSSRFTLLPLPPASTHQIDSDCTL